MGRSVPSSCLKAIWVSYLCYSTFLFEMPLVIKPIRPVPCSSDQSSIRENCPPLAVCATLNKSFRIGWPVLWKCLFFLLPSPWNPLFLQKSLQDEQETKHKTRILWKKKKIEMLLQCNSALIIQYAEMWDPEIYWWKPFMHYVRNITSFCKEVK